MQAALAVLIASIGGARAAEGGFSLYIPGAAGDIIAAFSPAPGLQVSNGVLGVFGNVDAAVLQGAVDLGVEVIWCSIVSDALRVTVQIASTSAIGTKRKYRIRFD